MNVGVVVFPGSNCEFDVEEGVGAAGGDAELLWHGDSSLGDVDAVVLPGGFAHGDYLRPGAIARFSPVMEAVTDHAAAGGVVIGICNGFQVLTEAGLLPGALQKNRGLKFLCRPVELRVETARSALTTDVPPGNRSTRFAGRIAPVTFSTTPVAAFMYRRSFASFDVSAGFRLIFAFTSARDTRSNISLCRSAPC